MLTSFVLIFGFFGTMNGIGKKIESNSKFYKNDIAPTPKNKDIDERTKKRKKKLKYTAHLTVHIKKEEAKKCLEYVARMRLFIHGQRCTLPIPDHDR
jgi:hypothetical protein